MSSLQVVFLHGSGGRPDVWALQLARFEGAVAPWLADPADGPPPESAAEAAGRARQTLVAMPSPRVLVAHSLGGAVALELSLSDPELVDGLVLITTGARLPVPDWVIDHAETDHAAEARRLVEAAFADPSGPLAKRAEESLLEVGAAPLAAAYRACQAHDVRGRLEAIGVPALVIGAALDPLTPPWLSEELAQRLPNAHLVVVDQASHMLITEYAAPVNLLIAGYLARLELTLAGE